MLAVTTETVKVGSGAITKLKSIEWAENMVRNNEKSLRGFQWRKLLIIDCETWH